MTDNPHQGGSYVRNRKTGELRRVEHTEREAAAAQDSASAPAGTAAKGTSTPKEKR